MMARAKPRGKLSRSLPATLCCKTANSLETNQQQASLALERRTRVTLDRVCLVSDAQYNAFKSTRFFVENFWAAVIAKRQYIQRQETYR